MILSWRGPLPTFSASSNIALIPYLVRVESLIKNLLIPTTLVVYYTKLSIFVYKKPEKSAKNLKNQQKKLKIFQNLPFSALLTSRNQFIHPEKAYFTTKQNSTINLLDSFINHH